MTTVITGPYGPFTYTVATGAWWWSDDLYRIHGFEPGDVVPTPALDDDLGLLERVEDLAVEQLVPELTSVTPIERIASATD